MAGPGETPDARWDAPARPPSASVARPAAGDLLRLNVYEIENNPFQPRRDFDEAAIGELAESIKTHGLLQPLVVRRHGDRWQLVAGERRLRAAIKAGWSDVPVTVHEADDRQMAEIAMVENLQRKDLNPLEKAASFEAYLDQYGCTQEELAGRLHVDRSTIANLIRLLELPDGRAGRGPQRRHLAGARPGAVAAGRRRAAAGALPADSSRVAFGPGDRRTGARHDPRGRRSARPARPRCRPSAPKPARRPADTAPRSSKNCARRWGRRSKCGRAPPAAERS